MNFNTTKEEDSFIYKIGERAYKMAIKNGIEYDEVYCQMDITATHCNGNPLDLEKLLNADDYNFGHDVFGIRKYINRENGKLTDCFSPRCSSRS